MTRWSRHCCRAHSAVGGLKSSTSKKAKTQEDRAYAARAAWRVGTFKENFIGNWNRRAALAHREAEAVQVKPLEWTHLPDAFPPMWITKTAIGSYHIEEAAGSDSPSFDLFNPMAGPMGNYEGLDEAKAAAQADYEHRIRSALVAPLEVDGSGRTLDGKWVLVPVEPTVAMSAAGMRYIKSVQTDHFQKYAGGIANSIYEKMLTAAQEGR